jgi:hypothetical protein
MIRMIFGLFLIAASVGGMEQGFAGTAPWLFAGTLLFLWGTVSRASF